jgi:pimeloyl-ACP methyl ester carboxylesterase
MGARILMDFYPKYRDRVATLFLCDCFFDYKILSKDKQKEFIDLRQKPLKSGKTLSEIAPALINSLVGPNCSDEAKLKIKHSFLKIHIESYLKTISESITYNASSNLSKFNIPTQLVYGEYDKLTPVSIGYLAKEKIKNSSLNIIKNAGHLSNIEQPLSFNKILLEFLLEHKDKANFKEV